MVNLKVIFLGTGAAGGTPGTGKSKRLESSLYIQGKTSILIDVTTHFLKQSRHLKDLDYFLITHGHKDACGGINKFVFSPRSKIKYLKKPIPIYGHKKTTGVTYPISSGGTIKLDTWEVSALEVPHAKDPRFPTFAYKLKSASRRTIVYASDMAKITKNFEKFCQGADILIIDGAMWKRRIFSHLSIDQELPKICQWMVEKIILTQIGRSAPPHKQFEKEVKKLCKKALPAYDGMVIKL